MKIDERRIIYVRVGKWIHRGVALDVPAPFFASGCRVTPSKRQKVALEEAQELVEDGKASWCGRCCG